MAEFDIGDGVSLALMGGVVEGRSHLPARRFSG